MVLEFSEAARLLSGDQEVGPHASGDWSLDYGSVERAFGIVIRHVEKSLRIVSIDGHWDSIISLDLERNKRKVSTAISDLNASFPFHSVSQLVQIESIIEVAHDAESLTDPHGPHGK
jgi:hypothetical protein